MTTKHRTTPSDVTDTLQTRYCDQCGELGPYSNTCNDCPVQRAIEANHHEKGG